jgi:hypothetical protein
VFGWRSNFECLDVRRRWLRDWSLKFIALGLTFRTVGPGIFYTTMYRRILRRCLRVFGETRDPHVIPSTLLPWFTASWLFFLFPKLKNTMKGTRFEAVSAIQQTVTRELKAIRKETFSRALDSLYERCITFCRSRRGLYWVMVLINIFYLFCVVFMAPVRELNCHTVYVEF